MEGHAVEHGGEHHPLPVRPDHDGREYTQRLPDADEEVGGLVHRYLGAPVVMHGVVLTVAVRWLGAAP
jgi:hypothetical protein